MMKTKFTITIGLFLFACAQAFSAGTLDEMRQYIQNRMHPEQVQNIEHCGFRAQFELQQHLHELSPEMQSLAKTLLLKPTRQKTYISPYGHFVFHYDTSGLNAISIIDSMGNGVPDYVDSAAVYFNKSWCIEIDSLGFLPPPDSLGNPVSEYHIYFSELGNGGYGATLFNLTEDIPALPGENYSSYIEVDNNFIGDRYYTHGYDAMKVTAAHEFNHAVQLGYRFDDQGIYFMEMTSTWLEDVVYEDVNDYLGYLPSYFSTMYNRKFNSRSGEYAASLYLHMIEKKYGPKAVVKIWENIVSDATVKALDSYLLQQGSSFAKSQNNYASWLYFTGSRTQADDFFPEAADYPQLHPRSGIENAERALPNMSMRHVYLTADSGLTYRGKINASSGSGQFNFLGSGQLQDASHRFGGWQTFRQYNQSPLLLVMTNPDTETNINDISVVLKIAPVTLAHNPVIVEQKEGSAVFYNVPAKSEITIFTVNGRPLKTLRFQQEEAGTVEWNLRDRFGYGVSSGIYLYYINGSKPVLGKLAIVR